MLNRTSRPAMARRRLGMSGTRMSRIFEGRCVNTMVLTGPMSECRRAHSEPQIEPIGRETLHHESAAKCIQGEQAAKPENHATGMADAQQVCHFFGLA